MKNIFKIFGIAVLACSMMVACDNKNENEGNDTTPTTPTNTPSIKVTFGSDSWDGTYALLYTGYLQDYNVVENRVFKTQGQLPYVDAVITVAPGTYSAAITTETQYPGTDSAYTYSTGTGSTEINNVTAGIETQIQTSNGYTGDWHILNANLKMNAFDANTLTLSYELTAQMYDYYSWAYAIVNDVEDAEVRDLSVKVNNFTCENWTK